MAKNKAFNTKQSNFNEYMAQLDDLLRKNRGSALYKGYDVNPNAMLVPGKVKDPTGLGDQQYQEDLKYEKYAPQSTRFEAPNVGQIAPYNEPRGDMSLQADNQGQQNVSAADFFNQVAQAIYSPKLPSQQSSDELEQIYQQTGQKYAVQQMDTGEVRYNDGSVGIPQEQQQSSPVASMADGNVLWSDGWVRPQLPDYMQGSGVEALSQGLFGRNQYVTQAYGNINPIEPTPGNVNYGTDFRTRDLQNREIKNFFSEPLEVVEIYNQARPGSGYVGNYENRGYGNSILLRRQDGSMIRVSHFDNLGDFQVGDQIQPGQSIGIPGQTGNITGEHADVETYSPEGSIVSPDQFVANVSSQAPSQERLYEQPIRQQASQSQEQQPQQEQPRLISQAIQEAREGARNLIPKVEQAPQQAREAVAGGVAQFGQEKGLPELQASEVIGGQATLGEALSRNIEAYAPKSRIDTGLSELLRGDVAGAKANLQDTLGRVGSRIQKLPGQIGSAIVPQAQADSGEQKPRLETLKENISGSLDSAKQYVGEKLDPFKKAGENLISQTKDAFGKLKAPGVIEKQSSLDIDPNSKQVGAVSGQSIAGDLPIKSADNRDPFFRFGGSQDFASQLKDNADQLYGGALNTEVFKNDFYSNPKNVGNVFGQTAMAGEATDKYKDYLRSNIKEGFDQPYREEIRGDWKYKIPVKEYWENKYWNDQISETPEKLTGDFSYQDFVTPEVKRTAFKGEKQSLSADAPIFKSNAASLFSEAGDRAGKFVKGIGNNLASIYKPHPFSKTIAQPEKIMSVDEPQMSRDISIPETTRERYKQPTLSDYLSQGKTAAQFYAETGQQSTLDSIRSNPRLKFDDKSGSIGVADALKSPFRPSQSSQRSRFDDTGKQMSVGPEQGVINSIRAAAAGDIYKSPSGNLIPNFTPENANMTGASTGLPVVGQNKSPFKRSTMNSIRKWF